MRKREPRKSKKAWKEFGALVRKARKACGIRQGALAADIGMCQSELCRVEFGKRRPPREHVAKAIAERTIMTDEEAAQLLAVGYTTGWPAVDAEKHASAKKSKSKDNDDAHIVKHTVSVMDYCGDCGGCSRKKEEEEEPVVAVGDSTGEDPHALGKTEHEADRARVVHHLSTARIYLSGLLSVLQTRDDTTGISFVVRVQDELEEVAQIFDYID